VTSPARDSTAEAAPDPKDVRDVVAIDGPSGAGKSTVARQLARQLGWSYLDTGAMYRAVTWHLLSHELVPPAPKVEGLPRFLEVLRKLELAIDGRGHVEVDGKDITAHLRSVEVESRVSAVSALPTVRKKMVVLQRKVAARGPVVADGRDMGSVVFPAARWKFFLDAEPEERARRRHADFTRQGREVSEAEVLEEIAVRDRLDSTRADAPLRHTTDAIYYDTTGQSVEQVVAGLMAHVRASDGSTTGPLGTGPAEAESQS
jgi:cytidylate kinase